MNTTSFKNNYSPEPNSGCWLWTAGMYVSGYGKASLGKRGHAKSAHRLAWEIHNGDIPEGLHVLHKCNTRSCVNPDHLYVGTNQDNIADKVRAGRQHRPKGEAHPKSKLTEAKVWEIREILSKSCLRHKDIAEVYGVAKETVSGIASGRNWGWLQ